MPAARNSASATLLMLALAAWLAAGGCGLGGAEDGGQADRERTLLLARHQSARAAVALLDGDREGFLSWFPADGSETGAQAREDLGTVFDTLSPLPWRSFGFEVSPVDGSRGLYRIRGTGRLGDAGPPDRIAVVRHLRLECVADGACVVADETPDDLRGRYLMALHDPLVLQRRGFVVLAERRARARAEVVVAAAARARPRLRDLGIDTRPTVVVTVYGSAVAAREALGVQAPASRLVFFSHPPLRAADEAWRSWDVGVMGPWLRDVGTSGLDTVLRHELAHAWSMCWFCDDESPPALLVEGIAQAAEGTAVSASLREEVATGSQLWPLPEALGEADVWAGGDVAAVRLGYQVGGALVGYVVSRWGAAELRPFIQAVAAAEPTEAGMDEALQGCLGVGWREFYDGWRRYVLAGG